MPSDLPTTAIGLIAFLFVGAGYLIWRQTQTFMTYIEKKNGNLERTTKMFTDNLEERDQKFTDALIKQGERHQQSMDDLAARLEGSLSEK